MTAGKLLPPAGGATLNPTAQPGEWHRMWLVTQGKPWRTLGLIPVAPAISRTFVLEAAVNLARAGMAQLGAQVHVADATSVSFENSLEFKAQLRATQEDGRVIVAFAPPSESGLTVTLARALDAALLCVVLGQARSAEAKEVVDSIGASLFLGAVTFGG